MDNPRAKILVVDDDLRLRDLLQRYLGEQGYKVWTVADGRSMDTFLSRQPVDLVVLDLMLPGEDGLSICRRLQGGPLDIAVIMLTAKGDEIDRIVGLEVGADDYLPKPFNPRELVARITAVLRRRQPAAPPGTPSLSEAPIRFGVFALNPATRQLTRDGDPIPLTTGEFALLKVLLDHPGKPLSRDVLMEKARGREHEAYDRSIDVQISRLRRLIEDDPSSPRYIQTVWGHGYVFVPGDPA